MNLARARVALEREQFPEECARKHGWRPAPGAIVGQQDLRRIRGREIKESRQHSRIERGLIAHEDQRSRDRGFGFAERAHAARD